MYPTLELDYNKLLDMVSEMGYRLMKSGAEIYRVEESIQRLLQAYGAPRGGGLCHSQLPDGQPDLPPTAGP
ncbi:MAG: threonine/serine exporter family protein [Flavonifractor plautii]